MEVQKFKLGNKSLCLVESPDMCIRKTDDGFAKFADYVVTEDINFLPQFNRKLKGRYIKINCFDTEFNTNLGEIGVKTKGGSDLHKHNVIKMCSLNELLAYVYIECGKDKLKFGLLSSDGELVRFRELPLPADFEFVDMVSDGENLLYLLYKSASKYHLDSLDFANGQDNYMEYKLYTADTKRSFINSLEFKEGRLIFKLRTLYRDKLIGFEKNNLSEGPLSEYEPIRVDSIFDFAVYGELSEGLKGILIFLLPFEEGKFDYFNYLRYEGYRIINIEREYSRLFLKADLELAYADVKRAVLAYFAEAGWENSPKIHIAAASFTGILAFKLAQDSEIKNIAEVATITLMDAPANLIGHKYTCTLKCGSPETLIRQRDDELWKFSMMALSDSVDKPVLFVSNKNRTDIWYGSSLAFYGALKYFDKQCKYLLIEDEESNEAAEAVKKKICEFMTGDGDLWTAGE